MDQKTRSKLDAIAKKAETLAREIREVLGDATIQEKPRNSPEVEAKLAKRICLCCDRTVPEDADYNLGLDPACYALTYRKIRSGEWNREDLIKAGKIAVGGNQGKRPKSSQIIAEVEKKIRQKRKKS